jgi:hypothetical protein
MQLVTATLRPLVASTISDIIEGLVEPLLKETLKQSGVRGITLVGPVPLNPKP